MIGSAPQTIVNQTLPPLEERWLLPRRRQHESENRNWLPKAVNVKQNKELRGALNQKQRFLVISKSVHSIFLSYSIEAFTERKTRQVFRLTFLEMGSFALA